MTIIVLAEEPIELSEVAKSMAFNYNGTPAGYFAYVQPRLKQLGNIKVQSHIKAIQRELRKAEVQEIIEGMPETGRIA